MREWNGSGGQGPLAKKGGLNWLSKGPRVSSYASPDGAGLPT